MNFIAFKDFFLSKYFLIFTLVFFNILNFIDKVTTYFGMRIGLGEANLKTIYFVDTIGNPFFVISILFVLIASISIYYSINKISEKIKYANPFITIPVIFLIGFYLFAVVNNFRLLI